MQLPQALLPLATEPFTLPDGKVMSIQKAQPAFTSWRGEPLADSFGGKPALDHCGEPCFAELVILRLFQAAGWSGRWVETYGAAAMRPWFLNRWNSRGLKAQQHLPIEDVWVQATLDSVAHGNGATYSGCWDVVVWADTHILFAEAKLKGRDRVRRTQRRWLSSALTTGLTTDSFLVVEWTSE